MEDPELSTESGDGESESLCFVVAAFFEFAEGISIDYSL
jgi:hypothetical protein